MEWIDKAINILLLVCGVAGSVVIFCLWEEWKSKQ